MVLPSWVKTRCQPIFIDDLVKIMCSCLANDICFGKVYDCGNPEVSSYRELIELTAKHLKIKRKLLNFPYVPLTLSKLWVSLVTGASKSLVYPLIDSLNMEMINHPDHKLEPSITPSFTPLDLAIEKAVAEKLPQKKLISSRPIKQVVARSEVKSVQRLPLPTGFDAYRVAKWYFKWLPRFFTHIITVRNENHHSHFYLFNYRKPMLSLIYLPSRSTSGRQLFLITGGLLSRPNNRGRLEFRVNAKGKAAFAAIHDYSPNLPWWIYRISQAQIHRFVMSRFARFLCRIAKRNKEVRQLSNPDYF